MQDDYYTILGLPPRASLEEIKRAYRKLARRYHPDSSGNSQQEDRFQKVSEAYRVLANQATREEYDRELAAKRSQERLAQEHSGAAARSSSASTFSQGRKHTTGRFEGPPGYRFGELHQDPSLRLNNRFRHWIMTVFQPRFLESLRSLQGYAINCSGNLFGSNKKTSSSPAEILVIINALESLHGTTRDITTSDGKSVRIAVPAFSNNATILRVTSPEKQETRFRIKLEAHPLVERDELDLTIFIPITLSEALLGLTLDVPTLAGPIRTKIPPQLGPEARTKKLRLKGRGIQDGMLIGDLFVKPYVVLPIVPPSGLLSEDSELMRQIHQTLDVSNVRKDIPEKL